VLFDAKGNEVRVPNVLLHFPFADSRAFCFTEEEVFIIINERGDRIGKSSFTSADVFSEGRAFARFVKEDHLSLIDTRGEGISDIKIANFEPFSQGLARVTMQDGEKVYINRQGIRVPFVECTADFDK
jgi:hypothetical protein